MTLEVKLKKSGLSITKPRSMVFNLLKTADRPLSISELMAQLPSLDRSTIYRTIATFEQLGVIKRVWFGLKSKIELSEEFEDHHHHIVCSSCGIIEKIDHEQLEKLVRRIAKKADYKIVSHHIEIMGMCKKCLKNQN